MKKSQKLILVGIPLLLCIFIGISYSYYVANIKEINQTETILKSNELELIYTGIKEISTNNMIPGDSFTKNFTVENTSNISVDFNIYMQDITNTFSKDLVYTITDDSGVIIEQTPLLETKIGKSYIKTYIPIESKEIKTYTLTIKYLYKEEAQNVDQGALFNAQIGVDTQMIKDDEI